MVTDIVKLLSVKVGLPRQQPCARSGEPGAGTLAMGGVWISPESREAPGTAHYSAKSARFSNSSGWKGGPAQAWNRIGSPGA